MRGVASCIAVRPTNRETRIHHREEKTPTPSCLKHKCIGEILICADLLSGCISVRAFTHCLSVGQSTCQTDNVALPGQGGAPNTEACPVRLHSRAPALSSSGQVAPCGQRNLKTGWRTLSRINRPEEQTASLFRGGTAQQWRCPAQRRTPAWDRSRVFACAHRQGFCDRGSCRH